jgi:two-component system sensor histidine kinase UhpB
MIRSIRALYLRGQSSDVQAVEKSLAKSFDGVSLCVTNDPDAFHVHAKNGEFDVWLADYWLERCTAVDAWNAMEHCATDVPMVVLANAELGEAESVNLMRSGLGEFVSSEDAGRLGSIVAMLLEVWEARQARLQADEALMVSRNQLLRLTQQLQARIEEERTAVSREIHDDIGGALAAVKFDLAWIARRSTDVAVHARVAEATQTLQQALDASQRIMLSLRPAILDEGLVPALQWLVDGFQKRTEADVVFRCEKESLTLTPEIQSVAFSVVREGLTNVVKHANATRVVVEVSDREDVLTVEVTDDGVGLSAKALAKVTSFGILGLRERAQSVGGWLDVSSGDGGVSVILTVPLSDHLPDDLME